MHHHPTTDGSTPSAGFPVIAPHLAEVLTCGCEAPPVAVSFTGMAVCRACEERRTLAAVFLAAMLRGATPDELLTLGALPPAPVDEGWDALDRVEMRDAVDLLLAVAA